MRRSAVYWLAIGCTLVAAVSVVAGAYRSSGRPLPTTLLDFFQPGSQPNGEVVYAEFISSGNCKLCHEYQEDAADAAPTVIYNPWQGSMMAQAARDPLFYACLAVANADAAFAGDLCLRCHTPGAWISGRSEPPDGSALTTADRDGVNCSACHRMVDPVLKPTSPFPDITILSNIDPLPISPGGGNFILDPSDRRRGPYEDALPLHPWLPDSLYYQSAALCGTCHDVSNPVYMRQEDGTYELTLTNVVHPTADKYDMFPVERTYSEWLESDFADGGVDMGGRFGGNKTVVSTCQDCHMPDTSGKGCNVGDIPVRHDLASHEFAGGNAWVQDMVLNLHPNDGLDPALLGAGKAAAVSMLQRACSLEVTQRGNHAIVRIINETGHKLPSGYPEGRRMWIHVEVRDDALEVIEEYGAYDGVSADLSTADTKVYEAKLGLDEAVAEDAGLPPGEGFHFAISNVVIKDNRIPPRGFTNEGFEAVQAGPVGATYEDGQFWDDTAFRLPRGADSVQVSVFYQTASKEYIEFLHDALPGNPPNEELYLQWALTGKSPPVEMATQTFFLDPFPDGDANGDMRTDLLDYQQLMTCETGPLGVFVDAGCEPFDFDVDNDVDLRDQGEFQLAFTD